MNANMHDSYRLNSSGIIDIYSTEQVITNIDLEIAPELRLQLTGYVLDRFSDGKGIEGATVCIYSNSNEFVEKTCTDTAGSYMFANLPGGSYKLTAYKEGYQTAPFLPVVLELGNPITQNVVLPPLESTEALVYGRVKGTDNVPLAGVNVRILTQDGGMAASTVTSADGSYAVYGLPDGHYILSFDAPGYGSRCFELSLSEEANICSIDAALIKAQGPAESAAISGFITSRQGAPLASAWVGLYAVLPHNKEELVAAATTTVDGFYTFSPVPAGQYVVKSKAMVM